jgi:hypothetical protein
MVESIGGKELSKLLGILMPEVTSPKTCQQDNTLRRTESGETMGDVAGTMRKLLEARAK